MDRRASGIILSVLSAFLIGSNFVIVKRQLDYIAFPGLLFLWFAFASLFLFLIILFRKDIRFFTSFRKEIRPALIIGAFGIVAAVLFFASLSYLSPSFFAFVMRIATIVTVLLGVALLKERFTRAEAFGAVTAIAGTFILTYEPVSMLEIGAVVGIAAAMLIGVQDFMWKVLVRETHPIAMNFYRTFSIAVALFAYLSFTGGVRPLPASEMPLLVLGAILSPVLGVMFMMMAMSRIEASKVVSIRTIEPFIVVLYAFLFFQQLPSAREFVGGTLVVLGVATMAVFHRFGSGKKNLYKKAAPSGAL